MTIFQTFKDFLNIGTAEEIQKKCQPFIEQSEGLPIYRGYGGNMLARKREIEVRKDRRPRDSAKISHELMDEYFQEKFGANVRSAGLFATGDKQTAVPYGKVYYVFPVGDFKFVWGELNGKPINDSLGISSDIKSAVSGKDKSEHAAIAKEIMDKITWHTDDLPRIIKSGGAELAILVDKVIIVPADVKIQYSKLIGR